MNIPLYQRLQPFAFSGDTEAGILNDVHRCSKTYGNELKRTSESSANANKF